MTSTETEQPTHDLIDIVEEHTGPAALLTGLNEVNLKLGVLNVVEDALNPNFTDGATINEQIDNSAFDCATIYELPTSGDLMAILAHRIVRDARMSELAPRIGKLFKGEFYGKDF